MTSMEAQKVYKNGSLETSKLTMAKLNMQKWPPDSVIKWFKQDQIPENYCKRKYGLHHVYMLYNKHSA